MTSVGRDLILYQLHVEKINGFHSQSVNQRVDDIGVHLLNEKVEIGESNNINLKTVNLKNTPDDIERYSIGLSNSNFVIRDNINEVDKMTIDKSTGIITFNPPLTTESSISNLSQLEDVNTIGITDGNILFYNSNNNNFEFHNNTNFNSNTIQIGHLYIDTVNNRLGINVTNPEEDLEIDGNIQIDTSGLGKLVFYDKQADHEHAEVDADDDGTTGGQFLVKVKEDGGSVETRLNIRENGDTYFNSSNFFIKTATNQNFNVLSQIQGNTTNISLQQLDITANEQSNLATCNFIEDLSNNVATNTSSISTNLSSISTNATNITSNSNFMVSLCNQQDENTTLTLSHSNIISNVFSPYLDLNDPSKWRFRTGRNVHITENLNVSNQVYLTNLAESNNTPFPLLGWDSTNKKIFKTTNYTSQIISNSNQILTNTSSILTNSLSITDLTGSNSDLCNRIDNIITSSNYNDVTSSNSQSNLSTCNYQVHLSNQVDLNTASNLSTCNYQVSLCNTLDSVSNLAVSNEQCNITNYQEIINNRDDITDINTILSIVSVRSVCNSQSNISLCNQQDLLTLSNSNICNYIDNLVIPNYDDITSSNSQSNLSLCNQQDLLTLSNSNICNYIDNLVIPNYDDITSLNSQSNLSLCNQQDLLTLSNSNICNYIDNLVISNYDDITSLNSQSNLSLCNQQDLLTLSNSNICNYIDNLVIPNYDDITSSNSQSNLSLCNQQDLLTLSNSNICNYIDNLVISNYDDITSSNSQSNLSLCNQQDLLTLSNSNICNYIDNLVINNYDDITSSNSQSNLSLCNQQDLLTLSNSNICNYIDNLVINNYDDITSSNSQSNLSTCNYLTNLVISNYDDITSSNSQSNLSTCNYLSEVLSNGSTFGYAYGISNFQSFHPDFNFSGQPTCVAIGRKALRQNVQNGAIGIGQGANQNNSGQNSIGIGASAGSSRLGEASIAIGAYADIFGLGCNNTIILNAKNQNLNASNTGFYVAPITNSNQVLSNYILQYNNVSHEISFTTNSNVITSNIDYIKTELEYNENSQSNINFCNKIDAVSNSNLYLCNYVYINPSSNIYGLGLCNFTTFNANSSNSVAVGYKAGETNVSSEVTNVGVYAGSTDSKRYSVNLGYQAGDFDSAIGSVNLGAFTNTELSGDYSIAIGHKSCYLGSCNNTICINASVNDLNPGSTGLFINPITESNILCNHILQYNSVTKEITYTSNCNLPSGGTNYDAITSSNSQSNSNLCNQVVAALDLQIVNAGKIFLNSQSNLSLCNDIDLLSNSNSNLCNEIDLLSNSNLYLCNYVYIKPNSNIYGLGQDVFSTLNSFTFGAVALGHQAAVNIPKQQSISIGEFAGNSNNGEASVNIGTSAGRINSGDYSINIGVNAARNGSCNNSIIMNATTADLSPSTTGFFVNPITESNVLCNHFLQYNSITKEIVFSSNCNLPSGGTNYDAITSSNSQSNVSLCNQVGFLQTNVDANELAIADNLTLALSNSQSNVNLCNEIDSQSNSNVTLCNTFNSFRPVFLSNTLSNSNLYDVLTFNTTNQNYCYGDFNISQTDTNCLYNVALGQSALRECSNSNIIAIGNNAGDSALKDGSISIGMSAGGSNSGQNTVCIGNFAGAENAPDNSIILNATGLSFSPNSSVSGFYVNSPRQVDYSNWYDDSNASMLFNFQTKEITYSKHRFSKFIMDFQLSVTTSVSNPTILSRELGSMSFSGSTVTIPETGIYRIFYQLQYAQSNSATGRASIKSGLAINTNLQAEWATNYLRANSGIVNASLFLEDITLLQANDLVKIWHLRMDTNTTTQIGMGYGIWIFERLN